MAQSKERDAVSLSDMNAGGFLVSEAKRVETATEVQKQLLNTFEQFNQQQLVRAKQEVELASEFAGKMTSAGSVPDVMNACQNWISLARPDGLTVAPLPGPHLAAAGPVACRSPAA